MDHSTYFSLSSKPPGWKTRFSNFIDRTFKIWTILPLILVLIFLVAYPTVQLLRMSVSEVKIVQGKTVWTFVGLKHLYTAMEDQIVPVALRNTIVFVIAVVILETILALVIALLVSRSHHLVGLYRTVFLIPLLIPPVAIGPMWRLMYDYNYGFINQVLALIGIAGPPWTSDINFALPSIILIVLWH